MKYILASLLITSLFSIRYPVADNINIDGTVIDAISAQPVASALVSIKNSTTNTATDNNGKFSILANSHSGVLSVSALGYISRDISINKLTKPLVITLQPAPNKLEEVVVAGYGTHGRASKKDSRASAAERSLQGMAPGIVANRHSLPPNGRHYPVQQPFNTEDYDAITENNFLETGSHPLSTFSIDVDGASYSNIRRYISANQLPPPGSVRIEELINYFHYDYAQPNNEHPFSIHSEAGSCPWNPKHQLVLIGLQGKKIQSDKLPPSNLVFLIDVSGSMMDENKLPLVKSSMKLLTAQLREQDKVSIVVYAGNAGLVLPPTSGANKEIIINAIESLEAGGSTAGGAGIQLAYRTAAENKIGAGNNRVILCTDGDFNVGLSSDAALEQLIEEKRKSGIFLTVLGYGMGNYKDNKMQKLANKGNGNHAYIDNVREAKKVLVSEFGGTLFTIAKDVKLQVEFNPQHVQAYRLIGYENRMLKKEDFNNDKKDAGEMGSGHTVTALYEIIPVGIENEWTSSTDPLRYQQDIRQPVNSHNTELLTVKFRYKKPDGDNSQLLKHTVSNGIRRNHSDNYLFAAAVAEFGMVISNSMFKQGATLKNAFRLASGALGKDEAGYRREFLNIITKSSGLLQEEFIGQK